MEEIRMKTPKMVIAPFAAILILMVFCFGRQPAEAEPFIGEIRWVAFNFAPRGWMQCNGQILQISQYQALYALISNRFGGNGSTTFALPDLRGRGPIHVSPNYSLGNLGGEENHTLTLTELPSHAHTLKADPREGTSADPAGNYPAKSSGGTPAYGSGSGYLSLSPLSDTGGGQVHGNMKPYVTLNCIIATQGIFPTHSQ
jgi:microcystin-dependent protein